MFRTLAAAAALWAAFLLPAKAVQLACVHHEAQMAEASAHHGETLQWAGVNQYEQPFWFFASFARQTWTVWFRLPDARICTGPGYVGQINEIGGKPA